MLYITGVAQVLPINFINKQDFAAIGILHSVSVAIPSALNKEYLLTSKNISPKEGMNNMCQSPTDLGEQAVKLAVTNSSTAIEEIGLLIGDTSTPFENIPTEGQRIASRFGIKIPCYDILGSSGFIPLVLETLNNFKEEKLPKKIIAVTLLSFIAISSFGA